MQSRQINILSAQQCYIRILAVTLMSVSLKQLAKDSRLPAF